MASLPAAGSLSPIPNRHGLAPGHCSFLETSLPALPPSTTGTTATRQHTIKTRLTFRRFAPFGAPHLDCLGGELGISGLSPLRRNNHTKPEISRMNNSLTKHLPMITDILNVNTVLCTSTCFLVVSLPRQIKLVANLPSLSYLSFASHFFTCSFRKVTFYPFTSMLRSFFFVRHGGSSSSLKEALPSSSLNDSSAFLSVALYLPRKVSYSMFFHLLLSSV